MRRTDKEITETALISRIIEQCDICRLGLAKENEPYILPVSFGYDGQAIYFHTSLEGKKIEFMAANSRVCVEFERGVQIRPHDNPCAWTFSFQSVIAYGTVRELTNPADKVLGLNHIMRHYSGREWVFDVKDLMGIRVWKVEIKSLTGKQSKDKLIS